ncbi:hypothetical protein KSP40_PGU007340 [Platanthera guangdongensis]|uniref:Uncharacterized protein n=1 Tax=Platanthera guangdongensis TaxID=2320717 RepID=A0ABR2LQ33_9ASPA
MSNRHFYGFFAYHSYSFHTSRHLVLNHLACFPLSFLIELAISVALIAWVAIAIH